MNIFTHVNKEQAEKKFSRLLSLLGNMGTHQESETKSITRFLTSETRWHDYMIFDTRFVHIQLCGIIWLHIWFSFN